MAELNGKVKNSDDNSVGKILSSARKKKRLRYKKLSSELKIDEVYLIALEEENFSLNVPLSAVLFVASTINLSFADKTNVDLESRIRTARPTYCFPSSKNIWLF